MLPTRKDPRKRRGYTQCQHQTGTRKYYDQSEHYRSLPYQRTWRSSAADKGIFLTLVNVRATTTGRDPNQEVASCALSLWTSNESSNSGGPQDLRGKHNRRLRGISPKKPKLV